ncbi:MAG: DEAD/DEAH box helicase [Actinobacteria bacterium]|nr:DEAD/DEAH box helicase [Actinomycetota bacterium]MDA2951491.1 DEAD/DEAH box helicase [Actinomycetota bacterium]MDA2998408.1 DEAD/DEAH box helicase [Actinomycetota bacterium]MDP4649415.1 DEAD/DEAH box helicase [Ilumatobacteraceae bacterium]
MTKTWTELGVPKNIISGLVARGIESPFPVQEATLPDALAGHDICGKAPTGSGKTLAFGIAIATKVTKSRPGRPTGLVLVPTRELAAQVAKEISLLCGGSDIRVSAVYGGAGYGPQVKAARASSIVVATPGRLEDLIKRRDLDLGAVAVAVIDEADRMADMGFMPAVKRIMRAVTTNRQTLLFSATLDGDIDTLIREFQNNPKRHAVATAENAGEIDHLFWNVSRDNRTKVLAEIATQYERAIVFCRTKHGSDRLAGNLESLGINTCVIHGNRSQAQREKALEQFRRGKATVMVATDVAARGIHIDAVPVVVHFDMPEDPKDYIHRSGRTGRAGMKGTVISLIDKSMRRTTASLCRGMKFDVIYDDPNFDLSEPTKAVRPGEIGAVVATLLKVESD